MPEWVNHLNPNAIGYGSVAVIAILALLVFRIARRIVMLGYFVLYCAIGFGLVYAACVYSAGSLSVPMAAPIVGGLAFGASAMAIRAKLMRIVAVLMLGSLLALGGKFWSEYASSKAPGGDKSVQAENRQAALHGLNSARNDFAAISESLPMKDGKIQPGFIPNEALAKAGIDPELKKASQQRDWYTWLTGLFHVESEDLGIWTSGGSPEEARKSLQLKPK